MTFVVIHGTGTGNFCLPNVTAPAPALSDVQSGQTAVLQIVFDGGAVGVQYQCANVNFTSDGSSTNVSSSICSNSTGVTEGIPGTGNSTTTALTSANNPSSNFSGSSNSSMHSGASSITSISTLCVAGVSAILAAFL